MNLTYYYLLYYTTIVDLHLNHVLFVLFSTDFYFMAYSCMAYTNIYLDYCIHCF